MERITFVDDEQQIKDFKKKYNSEFELLRDKRYIVGGIDTYCQLSMTPKGIQALSEYKEDELKEDKGGKTIQYWQVIIAFITLIAMVIIYFLSKK